MPGPPNRTAARAGASSTALRREPWPRHHHGKLGRVECSHLRLASSKRCVWHDFALVGVSGVLLWCASSARPGSAALSPCLRRRVLIFSSEAAPLGRIAGLHSWRKSCAPEGLVTACQAARISGRPMVDKLQEQDAEVDEGDENDWGGSWEWDGWDAEGDLPKALRTRAEAFKEDNERELDVCREAGHMTVFLFAAMQFLFPPECRREDGKHSGNYVDCSFGRGGHSRAILSRLCDDGHLYAFDIDPTAARRARRLAREDPRFTFLHRPCADLPEVLEGVPLHGVISDVGVSNPQMDIKSRGFSLSNLQGPERPLDLRMNPSAGVSAADWLMNCSAEELAWVFRTYGDPRDDELISERVAHAIFEEQQRNGRFTSMRRFAELIAKARTPPFKVSDDVKFNHPKPGAIHPAKSMVHAIRRFMNRETEQLGKLLPAAFAQLVPGGRCLVSTFTPMDEQIVRKFKLEHEEPDERSAMRRCAAQRLRELYPLLGTDLNYSVRLLGNPIKASPVEISMNQCARSGNLYVLESVQRRARRLRAKPRLPRSRFRQPEWPTLSTDSG